MVFTPAWSLPQSTPQEEMATDDADIWRVSLDRTPDEIRLLFNLLSPDEQSRADRLRFAVHRNRYIASRGFLRQILNRYIHIAAREIRFFTGFHGKPQLNVSPEKTDLQFNLSHTHGLALYAVSRKHDIGIDVEYLGRACSPLKIARRFFTPGEAEIIAGLPEKIGRRAFFTCWTRKEAILKAKGVGLTIPLNQFAVSVLPEDPPALVHAAWDRDEHSKWQLFDIDPGRDYVASLAVEKGISRFRFFDGGADMICQ